MQRRTLLASLRAKLGLTREEMANKCEINRSTYSQIERGTTYGSVKFWRNLMVEFDLEPYQLCEMMFEGI